MALAKALKQFIIRSIFIFLALGAISAVVFYWLAPQHYFHFIPLIFIYFFTLNIVVFRFLVNSHNLSIQSFSKKFLILTFSKFFGSFILLVLFLYLFPSRAVPFLVIFIILYFTSLIQEVYEFLHFLKKRNIK